MEKTLIGVLFEGSRLLRGLHLLRANVSECEPVGSKIHHSHMSTVRETPKPNALDFLGPQNELKSL